MSRMLKVVRILKGGPGSGNFGHAGCTGEVGGSCGTSPSTIQPSNKGKAALLSANEKQIGLKAINDNITGPIQMNSASAMIKLSDQIKTDLNDAIKDYSERGLLTSEQAADFGGLADKYASQLKNHVIEASDGDKSSQNVLENDVQSLGNVSRLIQNTVKDEGETKPKQPGKPRGPQTGDYPPSMANRINKLIESKDVDQLRSGLDKFDNPSETGVNLSRFISGGTTMAEKEAMVNKPATTQMRNYTTAYLMKSGIISDINQKIPLVRGLGVERGSVENWKAGDTINLGPTACFSESQRVSTGFMYSNSSSLASGNEGLFGKYDPAKGPKDKWNSMKMPVLFDADVPPKRILNTWRTGAKAYQSYKGEQEWTLVQPRRARIKSIEVKQIDPYKQHSGHGGKKYYHVKLEFLT